MGDGSQKPIGDVTVGDAVMSYDPGTGEQTVQSVTATWPHSDTVVSLTLSDGTAVETTASHPWWVESKRAYIRTDHLISGDEVLTADGTTLTVAGVSGPQGEQDVYNLSITGPHTYYVSTSNVLVHNTTVEKICPVEEAQSTVQRIAQEQADRGRTELIGTLSQAEQDAARTEPWLETVFTGGAVHRETASQLDIRFPGQFTYSGRGPDFTHVASGTKIELTTPGQVSTHVNRRGEYVTAQYATYLMPGRGT